MENNEELINSDKNKKNNFKSNLLKILLVSMILGGIIALWFLGLNKIITWENLVQNKEFLKSFIASNYFLAIFLFILIYIGVTAFSIPAATLISLAGGFVFGAFWGMFYVNIGATIGATLAMLFVRMLFGNSLQEKYKKELEKFNQEVERNQFFYLLSLRFMPGIPFFLINILSGLSRVTLPVFIITTSIGIIPGSFAYCFAGSQLEKINSPKDVLSLKVFFALIILALVSLIPVIIKKLIDKKKSTKII